MWLSLLSHPITLQSVASRFPNTEVGSGYVIQAPSTSVRPIGSPKEAGWIYSFSTLHCLKLISEFRLPAWRHHTVKTCSVPFEGLWHIGNSSHLDQSVCLNLKETTRLSFSLTTKPWWDPVQLHAIPMFTYRDFLYRIMNQHESIVSCKYRVQALYRCSDDGILYYKVCTLAVTCIRLCLWPPNWESQYQNKYRWATRSINQGLCGRRKLLIGAPKSLWCFDSCASIAEFRLEQATWFKHHVVVLLPVPGESPWNLQRRPGEVNHIKLLLSRVLCGSCQDTWKL